MFLMSLTADTSHFDRSWLKAEAPLNMSAMSVTADTSHFDRSWLKSEASENMSLISVTPETSQQSMARYFAVAEVAFESYRPCLALVDTH